MLHSPVFPTVVSLHQICFIKHRMRRLTYTFLLAIFSFTVSAQIDSAVFVPRPKVGIFIPLYLDEVFDAAGTYKYPTTVPKNVMPGLEFYSGVKMALDSLQEAGAGVEVFIIDTKDHTRTLQQAIDEDVPNASLLIGVVQNVAELKTLADAANKRHIPFISATYPNDGGITDNPSLVILNSTLRTHNQAVYKYIQNNLYDENIVIFRKPGGQEDKMKTTLEEANAQTGGVKLKWRIIDLPVDATTADVEQYLDSTRSNVCYCATLDQDFGENLLQRLSDLSGTYSSIVFGMPNWTGLHLEKSNFKGLEVFLPTPFVTSSGVNPQLVSSVANKFRARSRSRASDMVYRGYEITLRFVSNMVQHLDYVINLSAVQGKVFSDFDIQPVRLKTSGDSLQPDYYENKRIYFTKKVNGIVKGVY